MGTHSVGGIRKSSLGGTSTSAKMLKKVFENNNFWILSEATSHP
jgi:hypothetical protein